MSLTDVAGQANISAATLSRIENSKQGLDFALFLVLAKVLDVPPRDMLDGEDGTESDPLVARIGRLTRPERAKLWLDLAEARRSSENRQPRSSGTISQQMEELFAQFEFMREELEHFRRNVSRRGRRDAVPSK